MEIKNNTLISIRKTDIINGKFVVPEEVTKIESCAFENRSDLEELDAQNVEIINDWAFHNCKNLKKVNAPHLREIWNRAFYNCKNLKKANVPHLREIGERVFENCVNLKKVIIPNLEFTYGNAFSNCTSLPCPNNKIRAEIYELALKYLNEDKNHGLCYCINMATCDIIVKYKQAICTQTYFPLFTYQNAIKKFGATGDRGCYWWPLENREVRKEFLKWCYENKN